MLFKGLAGVKAEREFSRGRNQERMSSTCLLGDGMLEHTISQPTSGNPRRLVVYCLAGGE